MSFAAGRLVGDYNLTMGFLNQVMFTFNVIEGKLDYNINGNYGPIWFQYPAWTYDSSAYPSEVGSYFDRNSYLYIFEDPYNNMPSFSYSMWVYFTDDTEGSVWTLNSENSSIDIAIKRIGNGIQFGSVQKDNSHTFFKTIMGIPSGQWILISWTLERTESETVFDLYMPVLYQGAQKIILDQVSSLSSFRIYFGRYFSMFRGFRGFIHSFKIWNEIIDFSTVSSEYLNTNCNAGCELITADGIKADLCFPDGGCPNLGHLYPAGSDEFPELDICDPACTTFCLGPGKDDCSVCPSVDQFGSDCECPNGRSQIYNRAIAVNCTSCIDESICNPCRLDCKTCNSSTNCTQCLDSNLHLTNDTSCAECPLGSFSNKDGKTCTECTSADCETCNSTHQCSKCKDDSKIPDDNGICQDCQLTKTCPLICDPLVCICSITNVCSSCINKTLHINGNKCDLCPIGTYSLGNGISCELCQTMCEKCEDITGNCINCTSSSMQINADLKTCGCKGNQAYSSEFECSCQDGYYESDLSTCSKCALGCRTCSNNSTCDTCMDERNMNISLNGLCVCSQLHYLDANSGLCGNCEDFCDKSCESCPKCVRSSNLNATFLSTYTKFIVKFPNELKTNLFKCEDIFPKEIIDRLGIGYSCEFRKKATLLSVSLGFNYTLISGDIGIQTKFLINSFPDCSYRTELIYFSLEDAAYKPITKARISAPTLVLYECQDLKITGIKSTGGAKHKLEYSWQINSNPPLQSLRQYNHEFNTLIDTLIIPRSALSETNITVYLTVKNRFKYEDTSSLNILSKSTGEIVISFDRNIDYQLFFIDHIKYSIGSISSCQMSDDLSITWGIKSVTGNKTMIDEEGLWNAQQSTRVLTIPKRALLPSIKIKIVADVFDNIFNISGTGEIEITVNQALPVIEFDRSDSSHWVNKDLILDASSSYDPNESGVLDFSWNCVTDQKTCSNIIEDLNSSVLRVSSDYLTLGSSYKFGLLVSLKNDISDINFKKYQEDWVTMKIVDYDVPTGNILNPKTKSKPTIVNVNLPLLLNLTIAGNLSLYTIKWNLIEGGHISYSGPINESSLTISSNSMDIATTYTLSVNLFDGRQRFSYNVSFYTNSPPDSGHITISPNEGVEGKTIFTIEAWDFVDLENNYPLSYLFGFMDGDSENYLNLKNLSSTFYTSFPYVLTQNLTVFVDIYDYLGAQVRNFKDIVIKIDTDFNSDDYYQKFLDNYDALTKDPVVLPSVITNLSKWLLNRDLILYGMHQKPDNITSAFINEVFGVCVNMTKLIIDQTEIDSNLLTILSSILKDITANPYLATKTNQKQISDTISNIFEKTPEDVTLTTKQSENFLVAVRQTWIYNSTELTNKTEILESTVKVLNKIQGQITTQMSINELREFDMDGIQSVLSVKRVSDASSFSLNVNESVITLPQNFGSIFGELYEDKVIGMSLTFFNNIKTDNNISSTVVDFTLYNYQTGDSYSHITLGSEYIYLDIPVYNIKTVFPNPECVFLDTNNNVWSTLGCLVSEVNADSIICACTHFSTFSAGELLSSAGSTITDSNIGDTVDPSAFEKINFKTNAIGLYFCAATLLIYIILAIFCIKKDRKDQKDEDKRWMKAKDDYMKNEIIDRQTDRNPTLNSDQNTPVSDQRVIDFHSKENDGLNNENLDEVIVDNPHLSSKNNGNLNSDDVSLEFKQNHRPKRHSTTNSKKNINKDWKKDFLMKHELSNILFTKNPNRPSFLRITLFFIVLLGNMFLLGVFYDDGSSKKQKIQEKDAKSSESEDDSMSAYTYNDFFMAIYGNLLMLIIVVILEKFMTLKPTSSKMDYQQILKIVKWNKIKTKIYLILAYALMFYFCWSITIFAIKFEISLSKKWVLNTSVSFIIDICVTSVIKVAVLAYLAATIGKMIAKFREKKRRENEEWSSEDELE